MTRITLLVLAACGSAPSKPLFVTQTTTSAGAEPREVIQFHYEPGSTHRTHATWSMTGMPPLAMTIDENVDSVAADGLAKVQMKTVDIEIPSTADKKVRDMLEKYRGQVEVVTVNPHGAIVDRKTVAGPDAGEDWISRLGFPTEAIGVGAEWDEHAVVDFSGSPMTIVGHRKLVSRDGTTIVVHTDMQASAKSDQGLELKLTGAGDTTYHLAAPLAASWHTNVDLTVSAGGKGQTFHMETAATSPEPTTAPN